MNLRHGSSSARCPAKPHGEKYINPLAKAQLYAYFPDYPKCALALAGNEVANELLTNKPRMLRSSPAQSAQATELV
jgi:hypothetical protein